MTLSSRRSWKSILRNWLGSQLTKPRKRRGHQNAKSEILEDRTLLSIGTLDPTFGDGGKVLTNLGFAPGSRETGWDIVTYQSDGKSVVVGGSENNAIAVRYNADGSLDQTFGSNGIVTIAFGGDFRRAFSVAVDSADRILLGGISSQPTTGVDLAVVRLTAGGAIDTSFGSDGMQTIDFGNSDDRGGKIAVDSADRVLVSGYSYQGSTGNDFAVARLTTVGELDASFSGDGKLTVDFGSSNDLAQRVTVDSANRVLVAGYSQSSSNDFAVMRLTAAGVLDTDFAGDGMQTIDFGGSNDRAWAVAVDSADRIIVGGSSYQGATGNDFAVARLTTAGLLDESFDSDGKQTVHFGGTSDYGTSVTVDSVDRILVAGYSWQGITREDFAVARLTTGGALDSSFDSDGKQTVDFGGLSDIGFSVAVDADNQVLVGGYSSQGATTGQDFAVTRLTTTGVLDAGFGSNGKVTTDIGIPTADYGQDVVAYQSDGKLLVVGTTNGDMFVVRHNVDGTLDSTFGGTGVVKIDFDSSSDRGLSIVIDSFDRILVGGYSYQGITNWDFVVARLTNDGELDTTFSNDGKQTIDFGSSEFGGDIALDSADRILIGGHSLQGTAGWDFAVARLTSDGDLDTTFDLDGKQTIDFGSSEYDGRIAVDSTDRVLIAGYSNQGTPTGQDFAVARLTASGALDTTFDGDGKQTIDFGGSRGLDLASSIVVDSLDRVLVAGYSRQDSTGNDFAVARLTIDGALDTAFDEDGKKTIDFGNTQEGASGITVDRVDRVLITGTTSQGTPTGNDIAVVRLTTTGILDASFGIDGKQTIDFGYGNDSGYSVAIDKRGDVLVAGLSSQYLTGNDVAIARLVASTPPTANAGGPYVVDEGTSITFDASATSDPEEATSSLTFEWDFNYDGVTFRPHGGLTGINPSGSFGVSGTYTIAVRVTDSKGESDIATTTLTVENVAPVVKSLVLSESTILEGGKVGLSGSFTDPGKETFHEVVIDWGDGSPVTVLGSADLQQVSVDEWSFSILPGQADDDLHQYLDNGIFTVTATANDGDGGSGSFDTTITVLNVAPTITGITAPMTAVRNEPIDFQLTATDVTAGDIAAGFTYTIDWGDGSDPDGDGVIGETVTGAELVNLQHGFERKGTYSVSVTATDKDGSTSSAATHTIEVSAAVVDNKGNLKGGGNNVTASQGSIILEFFDDEGNVVERLSFDEALVTGSLILYGSPGNDELVVDSSLTLPVELYGGDGDDILVGGGGTNLIVGGDGNDSLTGGAGTNTLDGGDGDDILQDGGGTNTVIGGTGSNTFIDGGGTNDFETSTGGTLSVDGPSTAVRGQQVQYIASFSNPAGVNANSLSWQVLDPTGTVSTSGTGIKFKFVPTISGSHEVVLSVVDDSGSQTTIRRTLTVTAVELQGNNLVVGGTTGADAIEFSNGEMPGEIEVTVNGESLGLYQPSGRLVAYGQDGNDEIVVSASTSLPAWLYGDAGNDRLKGGHGNDILLGGDGGDLLVGKSGRDLLVGGIGADRIVGNSDDDILIGGFLNFGGNQLETAISYVMLEWTSARTYEDRIKNITDGGGTIDRENSYYYLQWLNTVQDDQEKDVLTGSAGADWFFANFESDRVTDLKDEAFAEELDFIEE